MTAACVIRAWVQDQETKNCMACKTKFTTVRRRVGYILNIVIIWGGIPVSEGRWKIRLCMPKQGIILANTLYYVHPLMDNACDYSSFQFNVQ